jgi:hypothetical protein
MSLRAASLKSASKPAYAELVEALPFLSSGLRGLKKERQPFDKLRVECAR